MLTETQVRNARPSERPRKISDSRGLYLQVMPSGSRYWRFDYCFNDRRKTLALGTGRILRMLLADISLPVLAGNLIAWPLAYMAAQSYLQAFAQRVPLTPEPFLFSLVITLAVAWFAVGGQAYRAANTRPALALRSE